MEKKKMCLEIGVNYGDVDREGRLSLAGLFRMLQEGAIRHANLFDVGTRAMGVSGETWVLNRLAGEVFEWPRYEDVLRLETWSTGISGFRGYREFRVCRGEERVFEGSSLWLYVNLKTKGLVKVPAAVLEKFPVGGGEVFREGLERLAVVAPGEGAKRVGISMRYSDVDTNGHVNNTAYVEFLQTALSRAGLGADVRGIEIKFAKEISPVAEEVFVRVEEKEEGVVFSVEGEKEVFAQGRCRRGRQV